MNDRPRLGWQAKASGLPLPKKDALKARVAPDERHYPSDHPRYIQSSYNSFHKGTKTKRENYYSIVKLTIANGKERHAGK
jgi:hypothetical protein